MLNLTKELKKIFNYYHYIFFNNVNITYNTKKNMIIIDKHIFKYDDNNNLIYCKLGNDYFKTYEYDKNNNLVCSISTEGFKETYEYDNNNLISKKFKSIDGVDFIAETKYKYDANNNLICLTNSVGYKELYYYDNNDNLVLVKKFVKNKYHNYNYNKCYNYDKKGNLICYKASSGFKEMYKYDEKGNLIKIKDNLGTNIDIKINII